MTITVDKGGDVVIVRLFTLVVGPRALEAFWHRCYKPLAAPNTAYQSKVVVEARAFEPSPEGSVPGTRYPVTTDWKDHSLRTYVHFYESQLPETRLHVRLRIKWPGYYRELLDEGAVEPFEWTLRRETKRLKVSVVFKSGIGLRDVFRAHRIGSHDVPLPTQAREDDGTVRVDYERLEPTQNEKFGFRLERR